jgi:hypothetical protein
MSFTVTHTHTQQLRTFSTDILKTDLFRSNELHAEAQVANGLHLVLGFVDKSFTDILARDGSKKMVLHPNSCVNEMWHNDEDESP